MHFRQGTVCCLDDGNTIVGTLGRHRNTGNLCIHLLADGITRGLSFELVTLRPEERRSKDFDTFLSDAFSALLARIAAAL